MGGKQKKKTGGSKKKPSIFDKPMENPFLDYDLRDKVPVKAKNGKDLFDKLMENPFTHVKEEPKEQVVLSKTKSVAVNIPKRKTWKEVSAAKGWTYAIKRILRKKKS